MADDERIVLAADKPSAKDAAVMPIEIKVLGRGDDAVLRDVAPDVFDHDVNPAFTAEFLRDPCHSIAVAIDASLVVGFASGVRYLHPDKPPALWINEVGVAGPYRQRGIGKQLLNALLTAARAHGCVEAWVGTNRENIAAMRLYASAGGEVPEDFVSFTFPLGDR